MTIFTSPTGTKFKFNSRRDVIYEMLELTGYFEEGVILRAEEQLKKRPGTVIDVGANIGTVCIELATRFPDCQFHAFEPVPLAFDELETNIALNGYTNIKTHNIALSDKSEQLIGEDPSPLYSYGHICLLPEIDDLRDTRPNVTTTYDAVTLDSYNFQDVSLIKIDVEGMEYNVLKGALDTIERCSPMVILECWDRDWFVDHRNKLLDFIKDIGYSELLVLGEDIVFTR